jgi:hypothetical protein
VIKYSAAGVPLWTNRYNGPANREDAASAVALDADGNIFVTGYRKRATLFAQGQRSPSLALFLAELNRRAIQLPALD